MEEYGDREVYVFYLQRERQWSLMVKNNDGKL